MRTNMKPKGAFHDLMRTRLKSPNTYIFKFKMSRPINEMEAPALKTWSFSASSVSGHISERNLPATSYNYSNQTSIEFHNVTFQVTAQSGRAV